jgi:hypothetical protein
MEHQRKLEEVARQSLMEAEREYQRRSASLERSLQESGAMVARLQVRVVIPTDDAQTNNSNQEIHRCASMHCDREREREMNGWVMSRTV